ncbi:MFS transporter [Priestia aryabhattai]|uniref:MFS transporter n=1 Tax=Priestia aryabhattai TaxID=412384 RepID=UPI002E1D653C|nr:MFS transporter [Priestia aryabhattai]MED3886839.1 MFS transporter [Priestia aryabhattai]MED4258917.1 MFS transporter [Priestia aryabhattai]
MKIEKHWGISLLAVLAIGPGLMLNTSLNSIRDILQQTFHNQSYISITPVLIGVISFAFCIPFGPILRHKLGERSTYVLSMCLFLVGAIVSIASNSFLGMGIGRFLQGTGTGLALMMMIPMLVLSFPICKRNLALLILIGGFYGSSVVGIFLGVLVNSYGHWRWLFYIAAVLSLLGIGFSYKFLTNDHAKQQQKHHEPFDIIGAALMFMVTAFITFTLLNLQKSGWASTYVWIGIVGSIIFLCFLFIAEWHIKNPLIPFRLVASRKPALAILIAVIGNISMSLTLLSLQGLLKSGSGFDKGEMSLICIGLFAGIVIAAILSAVLYDKVGPGVLGIIGAVIIMGVNIQWMYVDGHASAFLFVISFAALIAGVGFTVAAGLMGAALGGPLPSLVPRMVTVQFIRVIVSAVIPVISSIVFAKVYKDHLATVSEESQVASKENFTQSLHVKSEIITYHTFSTFSCVLSIVVFILSFLMVLTGKGHKLAHKPHDKEKNKEKLSTEEVHSKKAIPVFERSPKEIVSNGVIGDSEYREALKKFGQPKPSPDKMLHMRDQEYRKALKRMKDIGQ